MTWICPYTADCIQRAPQMMIVDHVRTLAHVYARACVRAVFILSQYNQFTWSVRLLFSSFISP